MSDGTGRPTEAECPWAQGEGFCMTFVEAAAPEAVLERMVDGCGSGVVSIDEARTWASEQAVPEYCSVIEAGSVGGWAVTLEANGYTATLPDVVRRVSEGSRAIVVFRDIYAHADFLYAVDGVVVRSFDPLLYGASTPWDGPPLPEESGLDFGNHPMASAFACADRLTGFRITTDVLHDMVDPVAVGHQPLHSLPAEGSGPSDAADTECQVCSEGQRVCWDHHPPQDPLSWVEEFRDFRSNFQPGWIGWIQFLLCGIAAAALIALRIAMALSQS